jgi:dTMP kinase
MQAKFITLEGIDGAGKSSHVDWIAETLRGQGKDVLLSREPGGTALGEKLREILLSEPMGADSEAMLMFCARNEHLQSKILPALQAGTWVVCDRFADASYAYQGGGRGLPRGRIQQLEEWMREGAAGRAEPDATLLFDVPVEVARERMARAGRSLDRFEREGAQFYDRVRRVYLERAAAFPKRFRVIEGDRPFEEIRGVLSRILADLTA